MFHDPAFRGSWSGNERDVFYHNVRGRRFVEAAYGAGLDFEDDGRAVLPVDVDGDGDLDIAMLSVLGLRLMENRSPARHFARIRLEGKGLALGAVVRVQAGGVAQQDYVKLTQGFSTQVPGDLHFGLGGAARIEQLTIRWPSGTTETLADLPADRLLTIRQGSGQATASALPRWPDETRARVLPRFSLAATAERLDGGREALGGAGTATIVNFWAPWCAPCREELPALAGLKTRARLVGVSVERRKLDDVRAAIAEFRCDYAQFLAEPALLESFFGSNGKAPLPSTFVFDSAGRLRRTFHRPVAAAELAALLDSIGAGTFHVDLLLAGRFHMLRSEYDEAERQFRQAVESKPDDAEAWEWLGYALGFKGRLPEAAGALRRAVELDTCRASAHFNLGVAHYRMKAPTDAERSLREAVRLDSEHAEAHHALGVVLFETGRLEDAFASLKRALKIKPSFAKAYCDLAQVLLASGRIEQAVKALDIALTIEPDLKEALALRKALRGQ